MSSTARFAHVPDNNLAGLQSNRRKSSLTYLCKPRGKGYWRMQDAAVSLSHTCSHCLGTILPSWKSLSYMGLSIANSLSLFFKWWLRLLVFAPALWLSTMESRELRALHHAPSDMGSEDEQRKRWNPRAVQSVRSNDVKSLNVIPMLPKRHIVDWYCLLLPSLRYDSFRDISMFF